VFIYKLNTNLHLVENFPPLVTVLSINEKIINYMNKYVFSVTENTIKYSDVKMVFSVGKAYYEIFAYEKSGFNLE
jgi:hypothetical protein